MIFLRSLRQNQRSCCRRSFQRLFSSFVSRSTNVPSFKGEHSATKGCPMYIFQLLEKGGWQLLHGKTRNLSSLSKEAATAPQNFDPKQRWRAIPPANAVHLSIGSVYVYSMWTPGLTTALGVVGSAPGDWTHSEVLPVFSTAAVVLGITTSTLGSWVERVGPRKSGFAGSLCWSSALCLSGIGVHMHSLPLLYLGYGLLGGIGWGLMYLSPVTTVMKWFPDRRGLATGIALSAFGAGAAFAPTIIHSLVDHFAAAPDFVGVLAGSQDIAPEACVELQTLPDGTQVVASSSPVGVPGQPVVVATESDVARFPVSTPPGIYYLNTGDSGIAKSLISLGVLCGGLGTLGSRFCLLPHPKWTPSHASAKDASVKPKKRKEVANAPVTDVNIGLPASYVTTNTSQFPLLWLSVFGNATGGLALLSSSKLMLTDIWAGVAPSIVTSSFATGYVSALGVGMAVGRFGWSAISDYMGRQNTYALFGLGIPIVGLAPALCHAAVEKGSESGISPLLMTFWGGSVLAITFYGGIFSVLPAYIADLFGQRHSGAIHGKALTAWAASAVVGPMGLAFLRSRSVEQAIHELLHAVEDGGAFHRAFGCSITDEDTIRALIDAKTITISRLMELAPEGYVDPTPFLYDTTCYAAAGLMGVSALANIAIRPLDVEKLAKELKDGSKNS